MDNTVVALTNIAEAFQFQRATYIHLCILTLMVHDWLVLLRDEVKHFWRTKWSFTKILYLVSRYGPFLDMPILTVLQTAPGGAMGHNACNILYKIVAWNMTLGLPISEIILILRTNAIYSKSKRVIIPLSIVYVISVAAGIAITVHHKVVVSGPQPSNLFNACSIVREDGRTWFVLLLFLIFELLIVILTVWKGIRDLYSSTPLFRALYRDSVAFFLALFGVTLSAILILALAPLQYAGIAVTYARVVHSIICCRILLNLRRAAKASDLSIGTSGDIEFAAPGGQRITQRW